MCFTEPFPSAHPSAALPGLLGTLPPAAFSALTLTQSLVVGAGGDHRGSLTAVLPEGNMKLEETLAQSLGGAPPPPLPAQQQHRTGGAAAATVRGRRRQWSPFPQPS